MRTRVVGWGASDTPDLDKVYPNGVSSQEMARIMQIYPATSFQIMEPITASAIDRALAEQDNERAGDA